MSNRTPARVGGKRSSLVDVPNPTNYDPFDIIADKIDALMAASNPDKIDPNLSVAERKDAADKAVVGKLSHLPRMLKAGFSAVARTPPTEVGANPSSSRQSKRLRYSASSSNVQASSLEAPDVQSMNATFTDDSIAMPHRPIPISVQSAPYRRMSPHQMARISNEDEIILVIPEVTSNTPEPNRAALVETHRRIDSVLLKSCSGITPSDRAEQLSVIKNRHRWRRGTYTVYEYASPVQGEGCR